MNELRDKEVLITGASAGIGAATAKRLSAAGARVVVAARRRERLEALAAEHAPIEVLPMDVRDPEIVAASLEGRRFDVVVANAGLGRGLGPLHEGDPGEWEEMIDTNVKGVLFLLRHTLPAMIEHGAGDVVLLGSVAGRQVYPGGNVYCSTKHAVRAIYEALRLDTAGKGLRVTTVDPGMVETEFSIVRFRGDHRQADEVYAGMSPLRPEDVADAIHWAITRPPHVNIGEIVLWPTDQASTRDVKRE